MQREHTHTLHQMEESTSAQSLDGMSATLYFGTCKLMYITAAEIALVKQNEQPGG